ncbi:MAG: sulfatase [Thermoanaerobaculia bacterium]|nr:sulfatase [Thermoanaerobaculia bacterium]
MSQARSARFPTFPTLGLMAVLSVVGALGLAPVRAADRRPPNVVLLVVDTLRFDHLSSLGYPAPITPTLDRLLGGGVVFTQARVPEPLTAPSMVSMLTSLYPHEHGATRNGLAMRPNLPSLTSLLARRGYRTAAFVGNWTLRDKLTGLAEHFEDYREVLTRRRWFGIRTREATAQDLNEEALGWVEDHVAANPSQPFFLWIHYVEPHAPYRLHGKQAARLGLSSAGSVANADRYATEVAFVDDAIGDLLARLDELSPAAQTLFVFLSDHGESLGEHGEWGHGRDLYENCLHVPMGLAWAGHLAPRRIEAAASTLDLTPTVLGLLGSPLRSPCVVSTGRRFCVAKPSLRRAVPPFTRLTRVPCSVAVPTPGARVCSRSGGWSRVNSRRSGGSSRKSTTSASTSSSTRARSTAAPSPKANRRQSSRPGLQRCKKGSPSPTPCRRPRSTTKVSNSCARSAISSEPGRSEGGVLRCPMSPGRS